MQGQIMSTKMGFFHFPNIKTGKRFSSLFFAVHEYYDRKYEDMKDRQDILYDRISECRASRGDDSKTAVDVINPELTVS